MDAAEILEKLDSLGVEIAISGAAGDKLRLNPGAAVPAGLMAEVKQRKNELIKILKLRDYQPKYLEPEATDKELAEIVARVYSEGYILLWSTVLEDLVAFYKNATFKAKIPAGFIPYSLTELIELFGGKKHPSASKLRLIHAAKKEGARVESDKPRV